jgi:hypothetical protein
MKKILIVLIVFSISLLWGCRDFTACESISKSELIMLIDISDTILVRKIHSDLKMNFGNYMSKSGLGSISPCERFTLSVAPICSKEVLDIRSESIEIDRKGQSIKDQRKQADPKELTNLLISEMNRYIQMSMNEEFTSGSNIANVLIKALNYADIHTETTILLFSDLIENNQYLNMYNQVPSNEKIHEAIYQLIDPMLLKQFYMKQESGLKCNIDIVMKSGNNTNINNRNVKLFWEELFKSIGITEYRFIDNLSNFN